MGLLRHSLPNRLGTTVFIMTAVEYIPDVIEQHHEIAASLWLTRSHAVPGIIVAP